VLERLNQAMDHIERQLELHPGRPVDAAAASRVAATSEYHFRRLFSALAGMPLSEYVRRRRLTAAGAEVLAGERTLLDVAVRYGYGSGEAFARAFRAVHGVGPGEARRRGAVLRAQPRMSFRLVIEGSSSMRYRIVRKEAFRIVGRKARVPLVHEGMNPAIVAFLRGIDQDTRRRLEELSGQEPHGLLNVSVNLDPSRAEGTELDFHHGVATGRDAPDDMDALSVPAGSWAVFEVEGPFPEAVQHLWRDVFTQWFPANPYAARPGPEILGSRVTPDGTRIEAELWIPVEHTPAP
jgi:AraC family transcriptional regulator